MLFKFAFFSAVMALAAAQSCPLREVGVHEMAFTTTDAQPQARRMRELADFNWNVEAVDGFPTIAFNGTNDDSEVVFRYNYTGILNDEKNITISLFEFDCLTEAGSSLGSDGDYSVPGELTLNIDIVQETIAKSALYTELDPTAARIEFCARVDYVYAGDSLNFYETKVTIDVDLTANFTLDSITVERNGADDASATIDCDVEIYYCYQNYTEVIPSPSYRQGGAMEVCVRVVEEDTHCCVFDIDEMDIDQDEDGDGRYDHHTDPITKKIADPLSNKICDGGKCYVKTQLPSKFFSVRNPRNLTLTGVAVMELCDARTTSPTVSNSPSLTPSLSVAPSASPSASHSAGPSESLSPSTSPSETPSTAPSALPSVSSSAGPSASPSSSPSSSPSEVPSSSPSNEPSASPSNGPSASPSNEPTVSSAPSASPSTAPSASPSTTPSASPSSDPSASPSEVPSGSPSASPSSSPSASPSNSPSSPPTAAPSSTPSVSPSSNPSQSPTLFPYPYFLSGTTIMLEDTSKAMGLDISWTRLGNQDEVVREVNVTGFLEGTIVSYVATSNNAVNVTVDSEGLLVTFVGVGDDVRMRTAVDSLTVTPPLHSDVDFILTVTLAADTDNELDMGSYAHVVKVKAVADMPSLTINQLYLDEDTTAPLQIFPGRSIDDDDSETLSVRITVPSDEMGTVGSLKKLSSVPGVTFSSQGGGIYLVEATGSDTKTREATLVAFLDGGVIFIPRPQYSSIQNIMVEAISTERASGGDVDTKTQTAKAYIEVTIAPITDLPVQTSNATIVQENNGVSTSDPDLVVAIGQRMGLSIADEDGSQSLNMTLTGFPTNAQALVFGTNIDGVTKTAIIATGTVTISGEAVGVIRVLDSLKVTLADDDDENFTILVDGTSTDTNVEITVTDSFSFSHTVTVQAVADTPLIEVGITTKATVRENSDFVAYPVVTSLTDTDGSETYQSVLIVFSTPRAGAAPEYQFLSTIGVDFANATDQVTLTGGIKDIEAALASFQIRPGSANGEDITVVVTATSVESNTTETNSNGPGVAGDEIAVPTAVVSDSFVIPVDPIIEATPVVTAPANMNGTEDALFGLDGINVASVGEADTDGSEATYLEIDVNSYPTGTKLYSGGSLVKTQIAGFLRIPASGVSELDILPPPNFSGYINVSIRGLIIDTTTSNDATKLSESQKVTVAVFPDADNFQKPLESVGNEDEGPVAFGETLATQTKRIRSQDNGNGTGNNEETETFSRVVLEVPKDVPTKIYSMSGTFVPGSDGTFQGLGSAEVAFNSATRVYTITSTIVTKATDLGLTSQAEREQADKDIRGTLDTFQVEMGPTHTDENGVLSITATTLDVNAGLYSTKSVEFKHAIRIRAIADVPEVTTSNPAGAIAVEDGANIPLTINVARSDDDDGSETLSVRLTVPKDDNGLIGTIGGETPTDVTLTNKGGGVYLITATGSTPLDRELALNSFLNGVVEFDPRSNFAGSYTGTAGLRVDVISTEAASGNEVVTGSESVTVSDYIDIIVLPAADPATVVVKANAVGLEDKIVSIPVGVTLGDLDGSESFEFKITAGVPGGAKILGQNGVEISPDESGIYTLQAADVDSLAMLPPVNWSSALQGDITISTETIVTDTSGGASDTLSVPLDIDIRVIGVADVPNTRTVIVTNFEDQPYQLGAAIGNLTGVLVDDDGSESLALVIGGLPRGVIPSSNVTGGINNLGNGAFQVEATALPGLTLPTLPNFSGEAPYGTIQVRAVSQELDGDQATSGKWTVTFDIAPVADGFSSWSPKTNVNEKDNEAKGPGVSLSDVSNFVFGDKDGSEEVLNYTYDLSSLLLDAGIGVRLEVLMNNTEADLDDLVANYIDGTFSYNSAEGTITVQPKDTDYVALRPELFFDSNQDFSIPVAASLRDTAMIDGSLVTVAEVESTTFAVNLVGEADVPTVFAAQVSGGSDRLLPILLGGDTTDTDVALGREQSERIYYIASIVDLGNVSGYSFGDENGAAVGLDSGDGTWILFPEDVTGASGGLRIYTPGDSNGTMVLSLTTVAVENDGDLATNATLFNVTVVSGTNGNGIRVPPLPPSLVIGDNNGVEDSVITLNATATADPDDPTNPNVGVIISDIPDGAKIKGVILNTVTGKFVARASEVAAGLVQITPPKDFAGNLNLTVEAIATSAYRLSRSSGKKTASLLIDPVADGVGISLTPKTSREDERVSLSISLTELDVDGSETIQGFGYIMVDTINATFVGDFDVVSSGDDDAVIDGFNLVGYTRVPAQELGAVPLQPPTNWHGKITLYVAGSSIELLDDNDGDNIKLKTSSFILEIEAVADPPIITVPSSAVTGDEDTSILIPNLSATLADTESANGIEALSVVISNVPEDTLFNAGSNNGDGSWSIPIDALATLEITPPEQYAGTMTLTFTGIALEMTNGDEAQSSLDFTVEVTPVADDFLIVAKDLKLNETGIVLLDLNIRMTDTRGTLPGELTQEILTLTFGSVPTGVNLVAGLGGSLTDNGEGQRVFSGTQDQTNALQMVSGPLTTAGTTDITISGITKDGADILETPITDFFRLTVTRPTNAGILASGNTLTGRDGNDSLTGLAEGNSTIDGGGGIDRIQGLSGFNSLTGGGGSDTFAWNSDDIGLGVDTITDFTVGVGGDQLDFDFVGFDQQLSDISEFLQLLEDGNDTIVRVDSNGVVGGVSFIETVVLQGVTGLDLDQLLADGNLIV